MYQKAKPLPGQLENCELCGKRFTVTPYSKAGPDGGLLCAPCGKEMTKEAKAAEKAKKPTIRKARRKIESNRLDGVSTHGAKSLQTLCIEMLAQNSLDIEEFGELPDSLLNRLSEIFSKKRVMNPRTMQLFLRPDLDTVAIHESACMSLGTPLHHCSANMSQTWRLKTTIRFLPSFQRSRSSSSVTAVNSKTPTWII